MDTVFTKLMVAKVKFVASHSNIGLSASRAGQYSLQKAEIE